MGVSDLQLQSKPELPTRIFSAPLMEIEMEADHEDNADDTERHQHQMPSSKTDRPPAM
jgi:hypothetical protein